MSHTHIFTHNPVNGYQHPTLLGEGSLHNLNNPVTHISNQV